MMKIYILKTILFFILGIVLIGTVTKFFSLPTEKKSFNNYNVESNLFFIEKNKNYDFVIMGISHARNFSRHKNHLRTEQYLNGSVINFGRGGGTGGVVAQNTYLKHFYARGNKAKHIIYIPSPPMLFSEYLDNNSALLHNEPFRPKFFYQFLTSRSQNKAKILYRYLRSKYEPGWKKLSPWTTDSITKVLEKYDSLVIENGFKAAYPNGLDIKYFEHSKRVLNETIELAQKNGSQVTFVITPAMFGSWPGHDETLTYLKQLKEKHAIKVYDFSETCKDTNLYYDHHHFNTKGIKWFCKNHLAPIFQKSE